MNILLSQTCRPHARWEKSFVLRPTLLPIYLLAAAVVLLLFLSSPSLGQTPPSDFELSLPSTGEPLIIRADNLVWDTAQNRIILEGKVVVEHPDYRLECERLAADVSARLLHASGGVKLFSLPGEEELLLLTAEEMEINAAGATGWMLKSRLTVPWETTTFQFEGERIERLDEHTYFIRHGSFTWCRCKEGEAPDWSVSAEEIEAHTDGDVIVKNARVSIRHHPLFALPLLRYPLTTDRRTGFLLPLIAFRSSDNFQFELPFYLVINRSADLTIAPRWIAERGIDTGLEVRWNYGPGAEGQLLAFGIDDQAEHEPRGGVRLLHRTDWHDRFTLAADVAFISDNEVLFDFDHRHLGEDDQRALESRLLLSFHSPFMNLSAEFAAFDDLMGGDVRESPFGDDRDTEMIQRLPALQYTLLTLPLAGPLAFDLSATAINYYRQEAELGRGQMVSLFPRLSLSGRLLSVADFWLAAGWREWYLAPNPEIEGENLFTGRPEAELFLSSQWERIFSAGERRWRHSLRPTLVAFYADVPSPQPDDIFFSPLLPDSPQKLAGFHLDSRLWSRPEEKRGEVLETSRFELTQLYDFENQQWRDLRLEGSVGPPTPWRISLDAYYSWEEGEWSRITAGLGYVFPQALEIWSGYRLDSGRLRSPYFDFETQKNEALTAGVRYRLSRRHELEYRMYYSLEHNMLVRQTLAYEYLARQECWGLALRFSDRLRPSDPEKHELSGAVNFRIAAPSVP